MKGTSPLDNDEIRRVSNCFDSIFKARNRGLFMIGVSTCGHISELLSLMIGDVYQNGSAVTDLLYSPSIVKGGEVSRQLTEMTARRLTLSLLGTGSDMETPKRVVCHSFCIRMHRL